MFFPRRWWGTTFAYLLMLIGNAPSHEARAASLPHDFVALGDVAPDIAQDMRYASPHNFTGAPLPGYRHGHCWLTRPTAEALAKVQAHLRPFGLGLLVYDCYRPTRAVRRMATWARGKHRHAAALPFLGRGVAPADLFAQGYLSHRSAHCRGSTVDVALIDRSEAGRAHLPRPSTQIPCDGSNLRPSPPLLNFGAPFDCLSPHASGRDPQQPAEIRAHRLLLWTVMRQAGFVGYPREWWHFRLKAEPHPHQDFDVPLPPFRPHH